MKNLLLLFFSLMMVIRPVLPVINFVINYEYISKNLCEQRNIKNNCCRGKCQLKKDLSNSSKEDNKSGNFKSNLANFDVAITYDYLKVIGFSFLRNTKKIFSPRNESNSLIDYLLKVFRPPIG